MNKYAIVVIANNPLNPFRDREVKTLKSLISIQEYVDDRKSLHSHPFICILNGEPVLRENWDTVIEATDIVVFFKLPQGGGSRGGKNPLLAILGLAVMAVGAIFTGGLLAVGLVGVGAAMTIIGSGLLGLPEMPSTDKLPSASPTYSLSAQGNSARIGQPIPVIYGRHLIYPDFAEQPYYEFINNEQYLYHVLMIGQGYHSIHNIKIEDTDIKNFKEIEYKIIDPNEKLEWKVKGRDYENYFSINVVTATEISNIELEGVTNTIGPFIINPVKTKTKRIAVDMILPRGLYKTDGKTLMELSVKFKFEFREVDNRGKPIGDWLVKEQAPITAKDVTPIRRTLFVDLPKEGRWELKVTRLDKKSKDSKVVNTLVCASAKAYLTDEVDYKGMTLLLVKMKATNNLSGRSSRKINCLVTRKLPTWDKVSRTWSDKNDPTAVQETASPIWALADILKSQYGAKMKDEFLALDEMYDLSKILDQRRDYLNAVYDRKMSIWEALKLCARCARAAPILQGGVFRLVRDTKQEIPVAMFSGRNIVKDSFSIKYMMPSEDTVKGVSVEFLNQEYWKPEEVNYIESKEGSSDLSSDSLAKIKLFGCTEEMQARREGMYLARNNLYRRKYISFKTELEGYIPTFGDLIVVSHDMPNWGQFGEIRHFDKVNNIIELTEPLTYKNNTKYFMAFRERGGGMSGPWEIETTTDAYSVKLSGVWNYVNYNDDSYTIATNDRGKTIRLYHGNSEERTHYSFGEENKLFQRTVVKSVAPKGEMQVAIQCISEDDRVHSENPNWVSPEMEKLPVIPKSNGSIWRLEKKDLFKGKAKSVQTSPALARTSRNPIPFDYFIFTLPKTVDKRELEGSRFYFQHGGVEKGPFKVTAIDGTKFYLNKEKSLIYEALYTRKNCRCSKLNWYEKVDNKKGKLLLQVGYPFNPEFRLEADVWRTYGR